MSRTGKYICETELGTSLVQEKKGKYTLRGEGEVPIYEEITSPNALRSSKRVAKALQAINWSFTSDDTRFLTHNLHPYPAKFIPQIPGKHSSSFI